MIELIKRKLPSTIINILSNKDIFILETDKWTFVTCERWRVRNDKIMLYGYYDEITNNGMNSKNLVGIDIKNILLQSSLFDEDPVFMLGNGLCIEIFSSIFKMPLEFKLK